MSNTLKQAERKQSESIPASFLKKAAHISGSVPGSDGIPRVMITGDIRLLVSESRAGLSPVKGHYRIETEGMQEPLHVIWIAEGNVLNHTVHTIDLAFDLKGMSAGETLTRLLTVQVTESNG